MKKFIFLLLLLFGFERATAQTITNCEYWFDNDYSSKVTPTTTNILESDIDASSLKDGLHSVNIRFKQTNDLWSQTISHYFYKTSIQSNNQLAEFEYWMDDDFANKVNSHISGLTNTFSADVDVNSLKDGMHSFKYRYKDVNGLYSQTMTHFFMKVSIQTDNLLAEFEYWMDDNYDAKIKSPISGLTNIFDADVDVNSLKDGMHSFKYRYKDVNGLNSQTMTHFFMKTSVQTDNQLSEFEYWLDENYVNKVSSHISGVANTFNADVDVNSLKDGMHNFKYRYKDVHGLYSQTVTHFFYKTSLPTNNSLVKCEYWFDDDFSKKVVKQVTGYDYIFNSDIDVNSLSEGFHVFNIRFLDEHGNWSSPYSSTFENLSPSYPSVLTTVVTDIKVNSATSGGNVFYDGHTDIIDRGVCWNTTGEPTISDQLTHEGTGTGAFTSSISGLLPGTLYHVRAYATNSTGTSYGDDIKFTTLKTGGTLAFVPDSKFNSIDGVYPQSANYYDYYEYRVIYTHPENKAPMAGFPKVGIDLNGDRIFTGQGEGQMFMNEVDPMDKNYADGKVYSLVTQLPLNKILGYQFFAMDVDGTYATGEPTNYKSGPQVAGKSLDLSVYANDISFSIAQPSIGDKVVITAIIRNNSDFNSGSFKVKFYDKGAALKELTVPGISSNSFATISLDNIFPESGFHQIKVNIDENNTLGEVNILNNSAIRPIIVGSPDFKGSMQMTAGLSAGMVYPNTGMALYGRGDYVDSYDPNTNVSGAEVRMFIKETLQEFVTYTNSDGNYSFGFNAPSGLGTYHITVRMTDFTLSASSYQTFEVIPWVVIPDPVYPCPPYCIPPPDKYIDLTVYNQTIWTNDCIEVNEIIPASISFGNIGSILTANDVKVIVYKDDIILEPPYNYTEMPSGTGQTINLNISFDTPGYHSIRVVIDPDYTIPERNEFNNEMTFTKYIYQELETDLTPRGIAFDNNSPLEAQPDNIRFLIDNILCKTSTPTQADIFDIYNGVSTKIARLDVVPISRFNPIELNIYNYSFTGVGFHTIQIVVDPENNCPESNEENNILSTSINVYQRWPDLVPSPITLSNTDPINGTSTLMISSVTNYGTIQSGNFNVQYYMDNNLFGPVIPVSNLKPGENATILSSTFTNPTCGHLVELRVDEENSVAEQNEYNNNTSRVIGIDIQTVVDNSHPSSRDVWVAVGVSPDLWADIYNWGTFDAHNVGVTYEFNGDIINYESLDLPHGSSKRVNNTYMFNTPGDYDIYVYSDRNQQKQEEICEINEDNNVAVIHVHVFYNDLEILSSYINPSNLNPNFDEQISIAASFTNNGNANVGPFKVRFLVNSIPWGDDILVPEAARNTLMSVQATKPYSASKDFYGVHVIRVQVDPDNQVQESNKDNNEASRAIIVGKAPDLLFALNNGLTLSNLSPKVGETVTILADIQNQGAASATADLNFYLITGSDKIFLKKLSISIADHSTNHYETQWIATTTTGAILAEITNSVPQEYNDQNNTDEVSFQDEFQVITGDYIQEYGLIRLNGEIIIKISSDVIEKGFCYGLSDQLSINDNKIFCGTGSGVFYNILTELPDTKLFFYRSYCKTKTEIKYGEIKSFTVDNPPQTNINNYPYPIIFVHGINSNDKCFEGTMKELKDNKKINLGEINVFDVCLNSDNKLNHAYINEINQDDPLNDVRWLNFQFPEEKLLGMIEFHDIKLGRRKYFDDWNEYDLNKTPGWDQKTTHVFAINFDEHRIKGAHGFTNDLFDQSNQSAIYKQGFGLSKMIDEVIDFTKSNKVILVGHSMGGLAIREYLQRSYDNDKTKKWYKYPEHHVANVVTIGTPHLGYSGPVLDVGGAFTPDPESEAIRDMRSYLPGELGNQVKGIYLYGGSEKDAKKDFAFTFCNSDINCDSDPNSSMIVGLNDKEYGGFYENPYQELPMNIHYSWITSDMDFVVTPEYTQSIHLQGGCDGFTKRDCIYDTIQTHSGHVFESNKQIGGNGKKEGSDYEAIIRGMDEPDLPDFAYEIKVNKSYIGFATVQPLNDSRQNPDINYDPYTDVDWYYFISHGGNIKPEFEASTGLSGKIEIFKENNFNTPLEITGISKTEAVKYYVKIIHENVNFDSYKILFSIKIKESGIFYDDETEGNNSNNALTEHNDGINGPQKVLQYTISTTLPNSTIKVKGNHHSIIVNSSVTIMGGTINSHSPCVTSYSPEQIVFFNTTFNDVDGTDNFFQIDGAGNILCYDCIFISNGVTLTDCRQIMAKVAGYGGGKLYLNNFDCTPHPPLAVCKDITIELDATGKASITTEQINNGSEADCGIKSLSVEPNNFTCSNVGQNYVTLTVLDDCNNYSTCQSTVTVVDNNSTTVATKNATIQLDETGKASISETDIDNGSTDNCNIKLMVLDKTTFDCSNLGNNTISLNVKDESGNTATGTATVTVKDEIAPLLTSKDAEITLKNGIATVTENDVIETKSDNCEIASTSISETQFTCNDIGENNVTITVTDKSGNSTSKTSSIRIIGEIPAPSIAVDPEYPISPHGEKNTIYLGYGTQSVTLTASGGVSYSWTSEPSGFSSSEANPVVSPTVTTKYIVTATNQYGCTATSSVTINVVDARDPKNSKKVIICHKGNTQGVDNNAVEAHLAHGDYLGSCKEKTKAISEEDLYPENNNTQSEEIAVKLKQNYPNPFAGLTELQYFVSKKEHVTLVLTDLGGRVVANLIDRYVNGGWNTLIVNGSGLTAGTYFLRLESMGKAAIMKIVKAD